MNDNAPLLQAEDAAPTRDPHLLEQLYRVPLERPIGRELFTVMATLLAHVLRVSDLNQPENRHE